MNRLLFVIESLFPLGPAQQLVRLAHELAGQSFDLHVAVLSPSTVPDWLARLPLTVHHLMAPTTRPAGTVRFRSAQVLSRANCETTFRLRNLIRTLRPTLVQAWCGNSALITLAAAQFPISGRRADLPLFYTELFLNPEKTLTQQWYESRCSRGFAATMVSHAAVKAHLIETGFDGRIEVVPNQIGFGIAPPSATERETARQLLRANLNLPAKALVAGTVARLIPRTRLKDLIWATDLLTCVRDDFHFLIIGEGTQRNRLGQFAALTESNQHIHFLGEPPEALRILQGLDFYWHSHLLEPLPGNLLTAMALGIPAISVYGPGTTEIIRHQQTGFATNFGARDEFARWTKYLIEQTEPAKQLAAQGQTFVQQNFDNAGLAESYLKIWRDARAL